LSKENMVIQSDRVKKTSKVRFIMVFPV
jgi:hypothetical protein